MREEVKEIFNNPQTLRQKLGEYFDTYNTVKIEDYATSAETFFFAGGKQGLFLKATWSWFAFLFSEWYFIYKKEYLKGIAIFILNLIFLFFLIFTFIILMVRLLMRLLSFYRHQFFLFGLLF